MIALIAAQPAAAADGVGEGVEAAGWLRDGAFGLFQVYSEDQVPIGAGGIAVYSGVMVQHGEPETHPAAVFVICFAAGDETCSLRRFDPTSFGTDQDGNAWLELDAGNLGKLSLTWHARGVHPLPSQWQGESGVEYPPGDPRPEWIVRLRIYFLGAATRDATIEGTLGEYALSGPAGKTATFMANSFELSWAIQSDG